MAKPQALTGIHETYQGLSDFTSIEEYVTHWIRPNIFGDLDTIFTGAMELWKQRKPADGSPGRGDFFLAGALFGVMDHLGTILQPESVKIDTAQNIELVARELKTTADIPTITGQMGRHALTHGAWPQTLIPMTDRKGTRFNGAATWGFGLSFNANSNLERHDTFHLTIWNPKRTTVVVVSPGAKILKLVLNVHVLRQELEEFVSSGKFASSAVGFDRAKTLSEFLGNPFMWKSYEAKKMPEERRKRSRIERGKELEMKIESEIVMLKTEAKHLGLYEEKNPIKIRRDHSGGGIR